jgi:DNA-binding beta-propeller fold protein YncE
MRSSFCFLVSLVATTLAAQPPRDASALRVGRPATTDVVWPPRPEPTRVRFLGGLRSEADVGKKAGSGSFLRQALTGVKGSLITVTRPHDVWVDSRNRMYVADAGRRKLLRFDPAAKSAIELGGEGPGRLSKPMGIAGTPDDIVYVADQSAKRVVAFDASGAFVRAYGGIDVLLNPVDVAVDAVANRVYVADSYLHQVVVFDRATARLIQRIGKAEADVASAKDANRVAPRAHGDAPAPRAPWDTAGTTIMGHPGGYSPQPRDVVENRGAKAGEFRFPSFVAVGPDGIVAVSDALNFRVQVFDRRGGFVRTVGVQGDGPGQFARPKGVAVDAEGRIHVADAAFSNVQVFDARGRLLVAYGGIGNGDGELWMPEGLSVDAEGRIYVSDRFNNRVQVYHLLPSRAAVASEGESR